jgi:hypothetical protein
VSLESVELTVARAIPVASATSAAVIVPPFASAARTLAVVAPRAPRRAGGAEGTVVGVEFAPGTTVAASRSSVTLTSWRVLTMLELVSVAAGTPSTVEAGKCSGVG